MGARQLAIRSGHHDHIGVKSVKMSEYCYQGRTNLNALENSESGK